MSQGLPTTAHCAFVRFFSMLCLAGLCGGVALCVIKSTGDKNYVIAAMAAEYQRQAVRPGITPESAAYMNALARETALQAITLDPQDSESWRVLAAILEQESDYKNAHRARALAAQLGAGRAQKDDKQVQQNAAPMREFAARLIIPAEATEIE